MGGEGSMLHMINSLRNNKKLLRRKNRFKDKTHLVKSFKWQNNAFRSKKASPELLRKIRKEAKIRRRKNRVLYLIISLIVIIPTIYTVYNFNQNHIEKKKELLKQRQDRIQKSREKRLLILIENGDHYFEQRNWTGAIANYGKANDISPDQYTIEFRLVQAMCLNCEDDYNHCRDAKRLLDILYRKYPLKKEDLNKLKSYLEYEY